MADDHQTTGRGIDGRRTVNARIKLSGIARVFLREGVHRAACDTVLLKHEHAPADAREQRGDRQAANARTNHDGIEWTELSDPLRRLRSWRESLKHGGQAREATHKAFAVELGHLRKWSPKATMSTCGRACDLINPTAKTHLQASRDPGKRLLLTPGAVPQRLR